LIKPYLFGNFVVLMVLKNTGARKVIKRVAPIRAVNAIVSGEEEASCQLVGRFILSLF
jgi:hypothetical protein